MRATIPQPHGTTPLLQDETGLYVCLLKDKGCSPEDSNVHILDREQEAVYIQF